MHCDLSTFAPFARWRPGANLQPWPALRVPIPPLPHRLSSEAVMTMGPNEAGYHDGDNAIVTVRVGRHLIGWPTGILDLYWLGVS